MGKRLQAPGLTGQTHNEEELGLEDTRQAQLKLGQLLIFKVSFLLLAFIAVDIELELAWLSLKPVSLLCMLVASMPESYKKAENMLAATSGVWRLLLLLGLALIALPAGIIISVNSTVRVFFLHCKLAAHEKKLLKERENDLP